MFFQPPFPSNGFPEADAIIGVGIMFGLFFIFSLFTLLLIYFYKCKAPPLIMIVTYLNCVWMAMGSMGTPYFPFTPNFQIFILLLDTSIIICSAMEYYYSKKD